jgi:hypothetical protein
MGLDYRLDRASPDESGDPVEHHIRERWSRRRLLHWLLVATLALSAPTVALSLVAQEESAGAIPGWLLVGNLLFLGVIVLLVYVNSRGYTLLATWVLCGSIVLNGSEFFALAQLDRRLALYAVPVVLAAFLIHPVAAFEMFALSLADYLLAYVRHAGEAPFNWFTIVVLLGVACMAWLVARRTAWFEENEDACRRELEIAVAQREELERQVQTLRAELSAERDAAGSD